jgi:hypothetical protein
MIDNRKNFQFCSSSIKCFACKKTIVKVNDCKLNLNGYDYHYDCFKCSCCSIQLYFNSLPRNLPFGDKNGSLYCITHYIQSLKCYLCMKNFTVESNIQNIGNENDDEYLAHTECFKCIKCEENIKISNEFCFDKNRNTVKCKNCCENTLFLVEDSNLTTEQKEAIKGNFFKKSKVCDGANDFDCIQEFATKNSLKTQVVIKYINKCIDKIKKPASDQAELVSETKKAETSDNLIEQLTKLDKTLAPNRNPFV